MNISHLSVLNKIEEEIRQARSAEKSSTMKKHVYTIRTLCEMLLDEVNAAGEETVPAASMPLRQSAPQFNRAEKLQADDGANGDSIFDF
ncbi:YwdI family protein [Bacillus sp. B190/17]|uniref:YwdI family protein n=1 Tax=Bacillus lumedeiriae TaxID=3058829 RepID=A0ABW8I881_9BACI